MIVKSELREDKMGISFIFLTSVLISGITGCTDPGTPANGVRDPSESTTTGLFPANTVLHFSCNEGYLLDGPPKVICTKTGTWLPKPNPSCIAVNPCSNNPCQNGATCVDNVSSATGYYCHCPPVYHGNQCEQRMDCELPHDDEVPNSHYEVHGQESDSPGWYLPAATLVYKCYTGYTMQGSHHSRQCENGRWVGEKPECVKQRLCEDPGRPDHATRCCQNIFNTGVRLRFSCEEGYELSGSDERTCQTDGMWSGVQPTCSKVTTEPTPEGNMLNTETLTIVTATTGSILGILVVTVILTSRQCRSHRHRAHRNYPSALQARLARLHRHPDATALLAVTNNIDVVLPSYDEAIAPPVRASPPPFEVPSVDTDDQSQIAESENRSSIQGRPLPPLPPPNHGRPSRSRRSRGRRSSGNAEAEPLPPPYQAEPDDGTTGGPQAGNGTGAERVEVTHSMMGNDLYAEVNQRRDDPREDDEQNDVDNWENIHDSEVD